MVKQFKTGFVNGTCCAATRFGKHAHTHNEKANWKIAKSDYILRFQIEKQIESFFPLRSNQILKTAAAAACKQGHLFTNYEIVLQKLPNGKANPSDININAQNTLTPRTILRVACACRDAVYLFVHYLPVFPIKAVKSSNGEEKRVRKKNTFNHHLDRSVSIIGHHTFTANAIDTGCNPIAIGQCVCFGTDTTTRFVISRREEKKNSVCRSSSSWAQYFLNERRKQSIERKRSPSINLDSIGFTALLFIFDSESIANKATDPDQMKNPFDLAINWNLPDQVLFLTKSKKWKRFRSGIE